MRPEREDAARSDETDDASSAQRERVAAKFEGEGAAARPDREGLAARPEPEDVAARPERDSAQTVNRRPTGWFGHAPRRARRPSRSTPLGSVLTRLLGAPPLVVVWVLLWGHVSVANVVSGVVVAVLVIVAFPLPVPSERVRLRPLAAVWLLLHFVYDLLTAALSVSWLAVRPGAAPKRAVLAVPLRTESDLLLTITAELISLVPGSLVLDIERDTATLYVHLLDAGRPRAVERNRSTVVATERRVVRAFGSVAERRRVGQVKR